MISMADIAICFGLIGLFAIIFLCNECGGD
jgi:hypothetical protein